MDLSTYRFSQTHEWVAEESGTARVGISEYAQSQLGDVIYVELPKVGTELAAGARFGVVESVKAASDLYSPVSGKVVETNPALADRPELINSDPYGEGWMLRLEPSGGAPDSLVDEAGYTTYTEGL
jgi:glycine cleavage system H protein